MVNSRAKGIGAEQAVARWFRDVVGCPDARRSVAAGWRNGSTSSPDRGDIDGVPGLGIQVKALGRPLSRKQLADIWAEARAQAAIGNREPLLIVKRNGTADVGHWSAYLQARLYVRLLTGRPQLVLGDHLVCVELSDIAADLQLFIWQVSAGQMR